MSLLDRVPKPNPDRARSGDTFGFATSLAMDIPFPVVVRTWKEAVSYAAAHHVLLWARPTEWETANIKARIATIHNVASRMNLQSHSRRSHLNGRIYFEFIPAPKEAIQ